MTESTHEDQNRSRLGRDDEGPFLTLLGGGSEKRKRVGEQKELNLRRKS